VFCRGARERIEEKFATLFGPNDPAFYRLAQQVMAGDHRWLEGGIVGLMSETETDAAAPQPAALEPVGV
jgi:hypothetical protein